LGSVLKSYCLTSNLLPETRHSEVFMNSKTDIVETRVYRRGRNRDVLCRLTYQVTPYRQGLFRWFLIAIQELE
jgi:hypothetical protein